MYYSNKYIKGGNWYETNKPRKSDLSLDQTIIDVAKTIPAAYLVYTALLTQSGTDAPVATVLQNTLGVVPTFSYRGVGVYSLIAAGLFVQDKTFYMSNALPIITGDGSYVSMRWFDTGTIYVETGSGLDNLQNGLMNKVPIQILVFP